MVPVLKLGICLLSIHTTLHCASLWPWSLATLIALLVSLYRLNSILVAFSRNPIYNTLIALYSHHLDTIPIFGSFGSASASITVDVAVERIG